MRACLLTLGSIRSSSSLEIPCTPPGFKTRLNKSDRKEIIRSVCRLNRAIYYVSKMVSDDTNLLLRPCIDTGEEKIDPLRDVRVVGVLRDADVEEFCITPLELGDYALMVKKNTS